MLADIKQQNKENQKNDTQNNTSADGVKYSSKIDKKRKTPYNEYHTNAMIWARAADRKPCDLNILNANGKYFDLIEATEDGFVELKRGNYKEVQAEYERAYRKANNEIYGNLKSYESNKGTDIWDMQFHGKGRDGNGNPQQIEGERLQNNSSRNNEHLRNSNQGKYEKSKIDDVKFSDRDNGGYTRATEMLVKSDEANQALETSGQFNHQASANVDVQFSFRDSVTSESKFIIEEIQKISNDTPSIEMQEKWENAHKEYVEKSAWIRQMLAM